MAHVSTGMPRHALSALLTGLALFGVAHATGVVCDGTGLQIQANLEGV